MIYVACSCHASAHSLLEGAHDFHIPLLMVYPHSDPVAGNNGLGRFDGHAVEFDVARFTGLRGHGSSLDDANGPDPGVDSR